MSDERQELFTGSGRGQNRCTGRVGRGMQFPPAASRGRGSAWHSTERHVGHGRNGRNDDRETRSQDDNYRRNWPKPGIEPEKRASTDGEMESLYKQLTKMNITSGISFAGKLCPGTNGRSISLLTNYFTFKISEPVTINQYKVFIESLDSEEGDTVTSRYIKVGSKYRRLIVDKVIKSNQHIFNGDVIIYDCHHCLYSKAQFNFENECKWDSVNGCVEFMVSEKEYADEPDALFKVKLMYVGHFKIENNSSVYSNDVVKFFDLLLRYGPAVKNKAIGNNIFSSKKRHSLTIGKEVAIGFSQYVHNCECGLLLNVDRAVSMFYTSSQVINLFRDRIQGFDKMKCLPEDKVQEISEELKGIRIKVLLPKYSKIMRVSGVTKEAANRLVCRFEMKDEDGNVVLTDEMGVIDFFNSNSRHIRYTNFPCIICGNEYIPLEMCEIIGDQKVKNDENLRSEKVVKLLEQKPYNRFNEINNALKTIEADGECYNKEFGVSICPRNVQVTGRVLNVPLLKVLNNVSLTPDDNRSWSVQRPNIVFESIHIKKWILVYISKDRWKTLDDHFNRQFAQKLVEVSQSIGIRMEQPECVFTHDFVNVDNLKKDVFEKFENLQLIVYIISRKDNLYNLVKNLAVYSYGVITQCVSADHFSSSYRDNKLLHFSYLRNVSLQINSKLNGVNWILDVPWTARMKRVMFIGIDVGRTVYSQSIVSCVGTIDDKFMKYDKCLSIQDLTERIIDVKASISKLLQNYKMNNNDFPDSLIIYRKGIFEDLFVDILATEVSAVKDVLLDISCETKISYICMQRRADFHMLPVKPEDATSSLALPAGVVVDTVVTNPALHSFFLCSTIDYKGMGSPWYYSLLFDEHNLTADQVQQITHDICFIHPCSSRPSTVPVCVELAKACLERARDRIADVTADQLSICSPEKREECAQKLTEALLVHKNVDNFLYYI